MTVPVALFAHARPRHLSRTLASLRANRVPRIYAYCDGPKTPELRSRVEEVRELIRDIDWCEVSMLARTENLGLGRSIRTGVTDVLSKHDSVIVFEEDLICVDGTYAYLKAALDHYSDEPRVMSVTGWTHPRITPDDVRTEPYFDGRAECWVWGTWRRAWEGMDEDAVSLMTRCEQSRIDPYGRGADLVGMAKEEHDRNIWAVRFLYLHMIRGGLCLRPPHSMVEHIGGDVEATNAFDTSAWQNPPLKVCPSVPCEWPAPAEHPECRVIAARVYGSRPASPTVASRAQATVRKHVSSSIMRLYKRVFIGATRP